MTVYHRLTAEGIETMNEIPLYTFQCKVCGVHCDSTDRFCPKDLRRIVECVNGCAGLNPAAYQECVEALKLIVKDWEADDQAKQGLAGIIGAPSWIATAKYALQHAEGKEL